MTLSFKIEAHLGVISLNRADSLHALDPDMTKAIIAYLERWSSDPNVGAVLIQAQASKAFCAGGDIRWVYRQRGQLRAQMDYFEHEYRLNALIHGYPKPYIALMDGYTMGGGVGISLHGSHPIASENFIFAMPETNIGFFPDIVASYLLARCPGYFGVYLGVTGARLNDVDALNLGLVKARLSANDFPKFKARLKELDLRGDAFDQVDRLVQECQQGDLDSLWLSRQGVIDACFCFDAIEEIEEALKNRPESWCHELREHMLKQSPLSLKVSLQQLRLARSLDFNACLQMDLHLVRHFLQGHDFYEGIRAKVIDKDQRPLWQPLRLEEVSQAMVKDYFS